MCFDLGRRKIWEEKRGKIVKNFTWMPPPSGLSTVVPPPYSQILDPLLLDNNLLILLLQFVIQQLNTSEALDLNSKVFSFYEWLRECVYT